MYLNVPIHTYIPMYLKLPVYEPKTGNFRYRYLNVPKITSFIGKCT